MSLHPRHPLANMRDRWKFQLDQMPQGDARAMLRRCLEDVNQATATALLGVMAAIEEEDARDAALRGLVEAAKELIGHAEHGECTGACVFVDRAKSAVRAAESAMGKGR